MSGGTPPPPPVVAAFAALMPIATDVLRTASGAVEGAPLVRGAYQITPAADGTPTAVKVTYTA